MEEEGKEAAARTSVAAKVAASALVYAAIFSVLTTALLRGPVARYRRNDTHLVRDSIPVDGLEVGGYPTIALCQFPGFRHRNPFQDDAIDDEVWYSTIQYYLAVQSTFDLHGIVKISSSNFTNT